MLVSAWTCPAWSWQGRRPRAGQSPGAAPFRGPRQPGLCSGPLPICVCRTSCELVLCAAPQGPFQVRRGTFLGAVEMPSQGPCWRGWPLSWPTLHSKPHLSPRQTYSFPGTVSVCNSFCHNPIELLPLSRVATNLVCGASVSEVGASVDSTQEGSSVSAMLQTLPVSCEVGGGQSGWVR